MKTHYRLKVEIVVIAARHAIIIDRPFFAKVKCVYLAEAVSGPTCFFLLLFAPDRFLIWLAPLKSTPHRFELFSVWAIETTKSMIISSSNDLSERRFIISYK